MKKTFTIIGITSGVLVALVAALSFIADKNISITTRQHINSNKQEVFDQIRFMKNYPNWSPFRQQDPRQIYTVTGNDGEVGATFHWEGVKEESKGFQRVVVLEGTDKIKIECNITAPFEAHPAFDYTLIEKENGVEVVQDFLVEMPFPSNIFGMLFGVKKHMAQTNKQGLELLKDFIENKNK